MSGPVGVGAVEVDVSGPIGVGVGVRLREHGPQEGLGVFQPVSGVDVMEGDAGVGLDAEALLRAMLSEPHPHTDPYRAAHVYLYGTNPDWA
jgi:hypothetical protein